MPLVSQRLHMLTLRHPSLVGLKVRLHAHLPMRSAQRSVASFPTVTSSRVAHNSAGQEEAAYFSTFDVSGQVFLRTPHVMGIVNLKPIVPCRKCVCMCAGGKEREEQAHSCSCPLTACRRRVCSWRNRLNPDVLLIPPDSRIHRLYDLPAESVGPFFEAVQTVVLHLERALGCTSSNIAIQDGVEAGQTVPHLHVHILPRKRGDYTRNDEIYEHLDSFGWGLKRLYQSRVGGEGEGVLAPDAGQDRRARSAEEMRAEAMWLRRLFDGERRESQDENQA